MAARLLAPRDANAPSPSRRQCGAATVGCAAEPPPPRVPSSLQPRPGEGELVAELRSRLKAAAERGCSVSRKRAALARRCADLEAAASAAAARVAALEAELRAQRAAAADAAGEAAEEAEAASAEVAALRFQLRLSELRVSFAAHKRSPHTPSRTLRRTLASP